MSLVVADQDLVERLEATGAPELQDASGQPIGQCFTAEQFQRMVADWVMANVSSVELDADFETRQGRTLPEIWKRPGA